MKVGDIVTVRYPQHYRSNVEFWEMRPDRGMVLRFTRRKGNPVIGHPMTGGRVFSLMSGRCLSHMMRKHAPDAFRYAYAELEEVKT